MGKRLDAVEANIESLLFRSSQARSLSETDRDFLHSAQALAQGAADEVQQEKERGIVRDMELARLKKEADWLTDLLEDLFGVLKSHFEEGTD